MMNRLAAALSIVSLLAVTSVGAEEPVRRPASAPSSRPTSQPTSPDDSRVVVTDHTLTLNGKPFDYRAKTGTLTLKNATGKPRADLFYVAYEARQTDPADRPITFVFNGGPGAASVWLHLGTAGPRRLVLDEQGNPPPPPYTLSDNPNTWLDSTDLVFIDPVGTGYSRAAAGENPQQFFGVQEDIQAIGEFIRLYLTRHERWASPKFLAGESYGTTRAAALSEYLLDRLGINLNGIILVSTVLDFQTISFGRGDNLPYALWLPTYTAAAWHHKKLSPDLQADLAATLKQAEAWSVDTYLPALVRGAAMPAEERAAVGRSLARFTGLSEATCDKADLRLAPGFFRKALLGDARQLIGRFDARLTGWDRDPLSGHADFDPSFSPYLAAYTAAFNTYARGELKYETDLTYEVLSPDVHPWNFGGDGNSGYLDVADNLEGTMLKNPHLRVFVGSGYFDLATPYFATDYTLNQLAIPADLQKRIVKTYYPGGHMMYHHQPSQAQLDRDLAGFFGEAVPKKP